MPPAVAVTAASPPSHAVECDPSAWVPDEQRAACTLCSAMFTLFTRRHHCRQCGEVFCAACTAYTLPLLPGPGNADADAVAAAAGEAREKTGQQVQRPNARRVCRECMLAASRAGKDRIFWQQEDAQPPQQQKDATEASVSERHNASPSGSAEEAETTAASRAAADGSLTEFAGCMEQCGSTPLTQEQLAMCQEMRQHMPVDAASGLPSAEMVVRFLRATGFWRQGDNKGQLVAERVLARHLQWRVQWRPEQIKADDCRTAMDSGVARFLGIGALMLPPSFGSTARLLLRGT
jgi:hypothetical protein